MKIVTSSALRATTLVLALVVLSPSFARAAGTTAHSPVVGALPVASVGPYVGAGTYLIQVAAKLGAPSDRLADGTWLYDGYTAGDVTGTLVVTFANGRVLSLSLATPAAVAALRAHPRQTGTTILAAAMEPR